MKLDIWKEIIRKQKEALSRQIEYRRLKRVRRKRTPAYTYCKNCGKKLKGMYCSQCGQYALISSSLSGSTCSNTSKTSISSIVKYGLPYIIYSVVRVF